MSNVPVVQGFATIGVRKWNPAVPPLWAPSEMMLLKTSGALVTAVGALGISPEAHDRMPSPQSPRSVCRIGRDMALPPVRDGEWRPCTWHATPVLLEMSRTRKWAPMLFPDGQQPAAFRMRADEIVFEMRGKCPEFS